MNLNNDFVENSFVVVCDSLPVLVLEAETANALGLRTDNAFDVGEPFLMMVATDLWSRIANREGHYLQLLSDDNLLLTREINQHSAQCIEEHGGFLLMLVSHQLDEKAQHDLAQCQDLVEIERWARRIEVENWELGEIDGVLIGCWDEKPF